MGDDSELHPRLCTIRKWPDFQGYGFNLHAEKGRAGQYIGKVDADSPAEAAGMKEGDRIVEVEGVNIGNENHSQVVTRIKAAGESVTMLLVDSATDKYFKEQKIVVSNDIPQVVRMSTPPRPGADEDDIKVEADADINDDNSDKQELPNDGNGDQDSVSDVKLDNDSDKNDASDQDDDDIPPPPPDSEPPEEPPSYNDVQNDEEYPEPIREPSPEPEPEPSPEPERVPTPEPVPIISSGPSHDYHPRLCKVLKWPDFQGYGFNLHGEKDVQGQFIGQVDANSPAEQAGLRQGDRIVEVNGENTDSSTHQQVIMMIKAGGEQTTLLVVDKEADDYYKNNGIQIASSLPEVISKSTQPREKSASASSFQPRLCHIVKWPDFNGYGFNLHAEKERGGQYIGKIDDNSPAQDGGLRERDRIIEVNGFNIEDKTHREVIAKIKEGGEETRLLVVDADADNYYKSRGVTVTSSMPEVKRMETSKRGSVSGVTNGESQPTRKAPITNSAPPMQQANGGGDLLNMNLSAKEMRERLASKKKTDPKQKSNMDFKTKYDMFQKL